MKRSLLLAITVLTVLFSFSQNNALKTDDSVLFSKVKYRLVGPFRGGRSGAVYGDLKQKNSFYFGATGGGVWKTIDGGSNWKNISDKYFGGSIGCVAVAPSDNTVLYVGEGENTFWYKSVKLIRQNEQGNWKDVFSQAAFINSAPALPGDRLHPHFLCLDEKAGQGKARYSGQPDCGREEGPDGGFGAI